MENIHPRANSKRRLRVSEVQRPTSSRPCDRRLPPVCLSPPLCQGDLKENGATTVRTIDLMTGTENPETINLLVMLAGGCLRYSHGKKKIYIYIYIMKESTFHITRSRGLMRQLSAMITHSESKQAAKIEKVPATGGTRQPLQEQLVDGIGNTG